MEREEYSNRKKKRKSYWRCYVRKDDSRNCLWVWGSQPVTSLESRGPWEPAYPIHPGRKRSRKRWESSMKQKEELTKQIGQLTIEVNWLKKNLLNSTCAEERREMVERDHPKLTVKRQTELLEVNRTSVYYKPSYEEDKDIELMHLIDMIYTRWPHYGYRRIREVLKGMGYIVNKKRVLRLMRQMGIAGLCPGPNLSKRNHQHHTYPYLLRGVKAERPNHIWGIDITYIRMKGSFMYLVAIIDWYSRYVVSWELSQTLERSFVLRWKSVGSRKPLIINSDGAAIYLWWLYWPVEAKWDTIAWTAKAGRPITQLQNVFSGIWSGKKSITRSTGCLGRYTGQYGLILTNTIMRDRIRRLIMGNRQNYILGRLGQ